MLNIVLKYNELMKGAIEGPNCLDSRVRRCCSIKMIFRILGRMTDRERLCKNGFERGEIYSFNIKPMWTQQVHFSIKNSTVVVCIKPA